MNVSEEAGNHHFEAVSGNSPGCVLTAGTRTEVLACYEDFADSWGRFAVERGAVENKVFPGLAVLVISPVAEEVLSEETFLPGSGFEEARRDNLVCVNILQRERNTSAFYDVEFLFHLSYAIKFLGSVTLPVMAAAAAVSGLARKVLEPGP